MPHIRRHRNWSPFTMFKASLAAPGVVAAHSSWWARIRASVTSVTALYCSGEPGKTNGRPVSRQISA